MKDCKTFLKLQEVAGNKQAEARRQGYEGNTKKMHLQQTSKQPTERRKDKVSQIKETTMMEDTSHPNDTSPQ
jgi:hypothetical protein